MKHESRQVSLFRNGSNQAVRIPREFEMPGTHATITRDGGRLIIEPVSEPEDDLLTWLQSLPPEDRQIGDAPGEEDLAPLDTPEP